MSTKNRKEPKIRHLRRLIPDRFERIFSRISFGKSSMLSSWSDSSDSSPDCWDWWSDIASDLDSDNPQSGVWWAFSEPWPAWTSTLGFMSCSWGSILFCTAESTWTASCDCCAALIRSFWRNCFRKRLISFESDMTKKFLVDIKNLKLHLKSWKKMFSPIFFKSKVAQKSKLIFL